MKKFLIKITLRLHNFLYRVISKLAIEKGIHKKHSLMNYHQFFVDNVSSSDFVLDVGCGNGFLSYDMAKKAEEVTGIDIERREIKFKRDNLRFIFSDALSYDFKDRFDVIVLSNVLEHIEKRQEFLTKIKKLAPKILIRVPMLNRDWISLYKK